jgi:hypothetical protein
MEELKSICQSPWCKAIFIYTERDMISVKGSDDKIRPRVCQKCKSFDNELSGGITWEDREYEGDRVDDKPHQIRYKVTNFKI